MGLQFKKYKTKFRYALKPVFVMLADREKEMNPEEWNIQTKKMHQHILDNPIEFLGTDLPDQSLINDILNEIFIEFLKDMKIKRIRP
jgi:hypothetical protein